MLQEEHLVRFSRQLPIIGERGQQLLIAAKVLVVGAGGLGCPVLLYLSSSGIGKLGIIDGDKVELSNLPRQVLFTESDIGSYKAQAAKIRLQQFNSNAQFEVFPFFLNEDNAYSIVSAYDVVVDATDNYPARYLINTICRQLSIPLVSASIFQFHAQLSVFNFQNGPCYECLYPAPPPADLIPNCAEGGIIGVIAGVAGTMQAIEVLKIILKQGDVLSGKLLSIDLLTHLQRLYPVIKKTDCSLMECSTYKPVFAEKPLAKVPVIEAQKLADALKKRPNDYFLIDVRQQYERDICSIGGTLIPLHELNNHLVTLPQDKILVTYCKAGLRSERAAAILLENKFSKVLSLNGGILAWIEQVDATLRRY